MSKSLSLVFATVLGTGVLQGQGGSPDGLWQPMPGSPERIQSFGLDLGDNRPATITVFRLDATRLVAVLDRAGETLDDKSPIVSMPLPDGRYLEFRVQETHVMSKELSAALGNFKTYRGRAKSEPTTVARFEYGPEGLRAMILSSRGRIFIEPVRRPEPAYVSYGAAQSSETPPPQAGNGPPRCQVSADDAARFRALIGARRPVGRPDAPSPGTILRTYRLAVGATGEYTKFHGGTVPTAARAIAATVNRVSEVFQQDLGIAFDIVAREPELIHVDAATDPYTNDDAYALLAQNQRELDRVLGSAGYDLGHVLGTGEGGKAFPGACDATFKAQGATGKATPVGDPFDIDYVAHEIGHQLGANHTFNSTLGGCGRTNRFPDMAYEPGSGSTVLAYAGVCDAANLQLNSHPYFHAGTLAEILEYLSAGGGGACAARKAIANTPPRVTVQQRGVVVPRATPFTLSGSASDAEQHDLKFTWEEMDRGASAPPEDDADGRPRPLFRSYPPTPQASRMFPTLDVLRVGISTLGETLPQTPRDMVFRFTARDGNDEAGGFAFADVTVTVASAGPFTVVHPAGGDTLAPGSIHAVRWTVNGTDAGAVACREVHVRLSADDAASFPHQLARATANDGSQSVTVPAIAATPNARVIVECATRPFFNISERFTVGPPNQKR